MADPSKSSEAAAARWATRTANLLCSGPFIGLGLSFSLFVLGAMSLGKLSYMGQASEELKQFAIQVYGAQIATENVKILALYLAIGLAGGLLSGGLCALRDHLRGQRPASRLWRGARHLVLLGGVHAYFLARSVIQYPQLHAESLYDAGGVRRWLQVFLTGIPLGLLDGAAVLALALFVLLPLIRHLRRRSFRWEGVRSRELLGGGAALGILGVAAAGLALGTAPTKAKDNRGPNVLIIAVDSLRADRVEQAKYRRVAPRLQRLARKSVLFTNAYGTLARTFPSWATLLSGREPHAHGIRHMFPTWEARRRVGSTLPHHLSRKGYTTAVVSDYAGEIFGRVRFGFHHSDVSSFSFYEIIRQRVLKAHTHLLPYLTTATGRRLAPPMGGMPENSDALLLARRVNTMLDRVAGNKRFLLVAFFSTPHFPYAAPYPYYKRFTSRSYDGPFKYHQQRGLKERKLSATDVHHVRSLYDGAVAATDAAIGRILNHLRVLGIHEKTIVVITADHGENLYEGSLSTGHGDHLRGDLATRLPLLVYDPVHKPKPRLVASIVRDVDLAPTLAALVGHPMQKTAGQDLRPLLRGGPGNPERAAFMETGLWFTPLPPGLAQSMRMQYPPVLAGLVKLDQKRRGDLVLNPQYETLVVAAKHRAIRTTRWKLIYIPLAAGVTHELYDVWQDPLCSRNVADKHPKVTARLKKRLNDWMRKERGALGVGSYVLPGQ
ncbi:MAG: sulfatase [bacterium]